MEVQITKKGVKSTIQLIVQFSFCLNGEKYVSVISNENNKNSKVNSIEKRENR